MIKTGIDLCLKGCLSPRKNEKSMPQVLRFVTQLLKVMGRHHSEFKLV